MPTVSIRDLSRDPSGIVGRVANSKRPAVITRHGKILAAIVPVDSEAFEDYILAEFFGKDATKTEVDFRTGRLKTLDQVMVESDEAEVSAASQPRKSRRARPAQAPRRRAAKSGRGARATSRRRAKS